MLSKYGGGPEIPFYVTRCEKESKNYLGSPYPEDAYPDKEPIKVFIEDGTASKEEDKRFGLLISDCLTLHKLNFEIAGATFAGTQTRTLYLGEKNFESGDKKMKAKDFGIKNGSILSQV